MKKLGFGLMRLPQKDGQIDIEETKQMVDMFLEAGFTYFDTAWAYPGSEDAIRQALVERYPRDRFTIATKNAAWIDCKTKEDAVSQFETSLRQTGAGYFDYYLLHNLGEGRTKYFNDFDMWEWIQEKKREGLVKNAGFSFHSTPEELEELLTAHPEMDFVQLQINYADWENPAVQSRKCYEIARKYEKPIIVMEPVKGGMLATPLAADKAGVITVLSGMSSIAQMRDNLSYMTDFTGLKEEQRRVIKNAQEELAKIPLIPCTTCNYCAKVCPMDIGISGSFTAMNYLTLYGDKDAALGQENWLVGKHGRKRADQCIKCGKCEEACPQHIKIRENLEEVKRVLL